jgi:hypothetical protein
MIRIGIVLLFAAFFLSSESKSSDVPPDWLFNDFYGTPPPAYVQDWERLSIIGDRRHPFLVIWISPQSFARRGLERLLTLSNEKYQSIVGMTQSLSCLKVVKLPPNDHLISITQHSRSEEIQCALSHRRTCHFLTAISKNPDIQSSKYYRETLHIFAADAECSVPK